MLPLLLLFCFILTKLTFGQYVVSIFPQETKFGSVTHYNHKHWTGKNGLDQPVNIPYVKQAGTFAARWLNRDLNDHLFEKATEDPQRKGYPDPSYFMSHQHDITTKYLANMQGYGNPDIIMETKGITWPHWISTSEHHGRFPNNVDAAAEFVSLMIQAIDKGTNGSIPSYLEVINEPDAEWENTNLTMFIDFYQKTANKLTTKVPNLIIGGPALSAAAIFDRYNFKNWKIYTQFLDMAFANSLQFFSFHPFIALSVDGDSHVFHQNFEAKIFGLIDLVESYSYKKRNKPFNIIISAFGLGKISGIDENKPSTFLDWAYIYLHNAETFAFLERRDVINRVVAFLNTYSNRKGQASINYSILDKDHNERDIAQAFKLWKPLTNTMTYLRVDSQFHNAQRKIIPHALVDKNTGTLMILLHNHDKKATQVKLNFVNGWFHPTTATSTCEVLNAQKKPTLQADKSIHVTNSIVTVPAEASCFFKFHTSYKFTSPLLTQSTYYSRDTVIAIHGNPEDVHVHIPTVGHILFARLRLGISLVDKSDNPRPKSVQFNQHTLTSFYSLHSSNIPTDHTRFEMYEYQVPVNLLKQNNDVKMVFAQTGGYVSSVALVIGN